MSGGLPPTNTTTKLGLFIGVFHVCFLESFSERNKQPKKRYLNHSAYLKKGYPFLDSPLSANNKILVKLFSEVNRLSIFENYENTAILRAIDSVKRDATFGTAHLIMGVNTTPDNPPA